MTTRSFPLRAFFTILVVLTTFTVIADFLTSQWEKEQQINSITQRLATLRANLEFELYTNTELIQGVAAYVTLNPELDQQAFERYASNLFSDRPNIINIGGAKDLVVKLIYPLQGNEKALGLDYRNLPRQYKLARKAIQSKKTVLSEPVNLVQGGFGIVASMPVFVEDQNWGVISVILDYDAVIKQAGFRELTSLNIKLISIADNDERVSIFANYPEQPIKQPLVLPVQMQYGRWQLEAEPIDGWHAWHFHPTIWAIAFLFAAVALYVEQLRENNRLLQQQAYQSLRRSEEKFRQFFASHAVAMLILDEDGLIVDVNDAAVAFYGYDKSDLMRMGVQQIDLSLQQQSSVNIKEAFLTSNQFTRQHRLADGTLKDIEAFTTPVDILGKPFLYTLIIDITDRMEYQARWELSQNVFNHSLEGIMVTDADQAIVSVNPAFTAITGYSEEAILGQQPKILASGIHPPSFYRKMFDAIESDGFWRGEIWNKRQDGTVFPELLSISVVRNEKAEIKHYVAVFSDITQIKQSEEKLERLAHYDELTELPNRVQFKLHLHHAVCIAERNKSNCALLFLDLDRFKVVNDSLGHAAGDELLKTVTARLQSCLRKSDVLARLGGDEFVLMVEDYSHRSELVSLASKLIGELNRPFYLSAHHEINVGVSIGVACYPQDAANSEDLLVRADAAMYRAKQSGGLNYAFYTQDILIEANDRLTIAAELKRAVSNNELVLFLQPQFDIAKQKVIGAEALLRWNHPQKGFLTPADFIRIAEQTRSIRLVTKWLVQEVFSIVERWQAQGHDLFLSFNVSALDLSDSELVNAMTEIASHHIVEAHLVEIEIVESAIIENFQSASDVLNTLRESGFTVAIDDFGTGYSSLAYLDKLPIDKLKIDREFIGKLHEGAPGGVVKSIIDLAENFDLKVVAEGVENEAQQNQLLAMGCHYVQGFLYSKPIPITQFESTYLS